MITVSPYFLIYIVFVHWVSDFVTQTNFIGKNKSHKWIPFLAHITLYTVVLGLMTYPIHTSYGWWVYFVCFNGFCHYCVDVYSSQLSSYYHEIKNQRAFWLVIGGDQMVHLSCLMGSIGLLLK